MFLVKKCTHSFLLSKVFAIRLKRRANRFYFAAVAMGITWDYASGVRLVWYKMVETINRFCNFIILVQNL